MNKTNYPGPSGRQKHRLPVTGMLTAILLMIAATGCTDYADTGNRLPEGKYPITFSAAVDELTATRATTTENTWTDGDKVAIQIGKNPGTSTVKKYKADTNGNLTDTDAANVIYWQNTTESYNISAWYPYSDSKPTQITVQSDQSNGGYQASDCLLAQNQTVTFGSHALTFKHLPVKVVVNLKYGDQVTEQEVSDATVSIVNQATTSGTIADDGTVAQVTPGNTDIATNVLTSAASEYYQKSVQALLVPQQMKDKQFIKVSITTNGVERKYFYTPTEIDDANLTAGQQYTYNITVKKNELEVTAGTSVSWAETTETATPDENFVFRITAPTTGVTIAEVNGSTLENNGSGSYTLSGGNQITITADEGTNIEVKGLYDKSDGNTYTLKSDISITTVSSQS